MDEPAESPDDAFFFFFASFLSAVKFRTKEGSSLTATAPCSACFNSLKESEEL